MPQKQQFMRVTAIAVPFAGFGWVRKVRVLRSQFGRSCQHIATSRRIAGHRQRKPAVVATGPLGKVLFDLHCFLRMTAHRQGSPTHNGYRTEAPLPASLGRFPSHSKAGLRIMADPWEGPAKSRFALASRNSRRQSFRCAAQSTPSRIPTRHWRAPLRKPPCQSYG